MQMTTTNRTIVPTIRQFFLNDSPALTTPLACSFGVYCYKLSTGPFRLVRQYISKLTPSNICNASVHTSKVTILHIFYLKFFNTDNAKAINNFSGFLMNKIMPSIKNSFVNANNNFLGLFSFRRTFGLFRQFP